MPQPGEDYYNDGEDESSSAPAADESKNEDGDGAKTSILPRSFFPEDDELKVGNKCDIEIVAIHEKDVEVKYNDDDEPGDEKNEAPEPDEQPESGEQPPEGSMASMMG